MKIKKKVDFILKNYNYTRGELTETLHNCIDAYEEYLKSDVLIKRNGVPIVPYLYIALNDNKTMFGFADPKLKGSTKLTNNNSKPVSMLKVIKYLSH